MKYRRVDRDTPGFSTEMHDKTMYSYNRYSLDVFIAMSLFWYKGA